MRAPMTILLVAALAGCASPEDREPPLRGVNTPEERLFVRCVGVDPLFVTETCRKVRDELSRDPSPGLFGR